MAALWLNIFFHLVKFFCRHRRRKFLNKNFLTSMKLGPDPIKKFSAEIYAALKFKRQYGLIEVMCLFLTSRKA